MTRWSPSTVRVLAALAMTAAMLAAGCGYTLVRADAVPADVRTIAVKVELPERSDPLLGDALAREMRRVIRWAGRYRPVETGSADAVLVLKVTNDRLRAVAFDEYDEVLNYQRTVSVDAELKRGEGTLLWTGGRIAATRGQAAVEGAVVTSSSSFQGGDTSNRNDLARFDTVQLGEERKTAALEMVLRDLTEAVYARMTEGL